VDSVDDKRHRRWRRRSGGKNSIHIATFTSLQPPSDVSDSDNFNINNKNNYRTSRRRTTHYTYSLSYLIMDMVLY
jgi:hypothetical protein